MIAGTTHRVKARLAQAAPLSFLIFLEPTDQLTEWGKSSQEILYSAGGPSRRQKEREATARTATNEPQPTGF
jgi:hypothetical protein